MAAQPTRNKRATDNFVERREARLAVLSERLCAMAAAGVVEVALGAGWRQFRGASVVARALLSVGP